ncbi:RagB/SusD family nutrient uptake outer membrane protein [Mucilaginibacter sp. KACC 22063]|uniref:RagB/SusD family nutrient uptake outer membrane protein n=1 Tax=Mucilaginibacter sp. KACC 22063 TaxID=3025666 RepID=UPI00236573E3|nr:RagB/SusD family nutrient uptake outer membrane protein [Mucilaginibacter sp. KACC 22063]WDF54426.1 RagB/SusD family nutrient uptake outer membrane protein [Mucilaginibacter sp. KACC 22063]
MNRKYIKYTAFSLIGIMGVAASCKKSFLENQPKGEFLESNYYANADQALTGVVAAYDPLVTETGGIDNTYTDPLGALNAASDDCFAGGGSSSDMPLWQAINNYTMSPAQGPQGGFWAVNFQGVNRTDVLLQKLPSVPGLSADLLKRYTAEGQFLRAHYYFDLVRIFKNVPLILKPLQTSEVYNQPQAAPEAVYKQVETDLIAAIPNLPVTVSAAEYGRATQGAAKALLGKVYLYEKKWAEAAAMFADVNGTPGGTSTYGYKLMAKYGDIFDPTKKFNSESIFEIVHTGDQNYTWSNWNQFKSNIYVQMVGPRSYTGPLYYGGGYGFNPITPQLVAAMKGDPRYPYTIANIDSIAKANNASYQQSYQGTGYYIQKYAPLLKNKVTTGTTDLNWPNDYIEIRLADTYLMEAEALVNAGSNVGRAQALLDAVRGRVGLPSVPATLANIYNERRLELATEGHRWFDLVRTGQAPTVLAFKGFKAGKNEILPIPLNETTNGSQVKQNPGY